MGKPPDRGCILPPFFLVDFGDKGCFSEGIGYCPEKLTITVGGR
jgi:hypothetical protein